MPSVSMGVCEECGKSFVVDLDSCKVLPNMNVRIRKQNDELDLIESWADWVEYLSTHCPDCCYTKPPSQASNDWTEHKQKLKGL